ncbi:hypothetical protein ACLOJK_014701, partial [Asimina triloba]
GCLRQGLTSTQADVPEEQENMAMMMRMMMRMIHKMRDFMQTQGQNRVPQSSREQPRQSQGIAAEEVVASVEPVVHAVQRPEERLDMKAFHEMKPPVYQGKRDFMMGSDLVGSVPWGPLYIFF